MGNVMVSITEKPANGFQVLFKFHNVYRMIVSTEI